MSSSAGKYDLVEGFIVEADDERYRIIEKLGDGGNSSVYMAQCLSGKLRGLLFALKLFTRLDKPERLDRFEVELEFLKNQHHPAVMQIFGEGLHFVSRQREVVKLPFYVAEYLPKTLKDSMRAGMFMVDKVAVMMQLLSALAYLAENNIVHRDIKPENIFVKGKSAVLGDFGLLKAVGAEDSDYTIDGSGGIRHPRLYPSPELLEYAKGRLAGVDPKSDIFQLGLVAAEMFCGIHPLSPNRSALDDIELLPLPPSPGKSGVVVRGLILEMLTIDVAHRPSAADLFDGWDGVFNTVIANATALEGRSFW